MDSSRQSLWRRRDTRTARKQGKTHVDEVVGVSSALRPREEDRRVDLPHGLVDLVEALRVALRTRAVPASRIGASGCALRNHSRRILMPRWPKGLWPKLEAEKMQGKGCMVTHSR